MIPVEKFKTKPMAHQVTGVEHAVSGPSALFDEQGTGKSKQAVDAACCLYDSEQIDVCLIVCPAAVRGTWTGQEYGQIKEHCWVPHCVGTWDSDALKRGIKWRIKGDGIGGRLDFIVTSYSFLRSKECRLALEREHLRGKRVLMVLDEAHFIKNRTALQSKAVRALRDSVDHVLLLTGTPYVNDVTDLWHQIQVIDPTAFPYNYYAFRAMFAKTKKMQFGTSTFEKVVGVKDKERLDQLLAPYVLRRRKEDCLDLPSKVYSVVEVPLVDKSWEMYESMRDELIAFFEASSSTAVNAGVRVVRLQQLTSGFLGGIRPEECKRCGRTVGQHEVGDGCDGFYAPVDPPLEVSAEKLEAFLAWRESQEPPVVTWARFRPEIERLEQALRTNEELKVGVVYGGQTDKQRLAVVEAFSRGDLTDLIGQQQAGGVGLNLQRSSTVAVLSNTWSLVDRLQSEDRTHRKGTTKPVTYTDFVCTSPDGKKTVDHLILQAIRQKQSLADYTMADWRKALVK